MCVLSDVDVVKGVIKGRRTVKPSDFDGRVIEREVVEEILECGNWAPSHGQTEPWRFQVFAGKGRQRLVEFLPRLYKEVTPKHLFLERKLMKLAAQPLQASHVVAICMRRQVVGKVPEVEELEAVACAVQNMQLAARVYGVGCFWSTGLQAYTTEALDFFGLSEPDLFLGLLYLGYPSDGFPVGKRGAVADKVVWHENV